MATEPSVGRTLARLARQVELGAASVELTLAQYRVLSSLGEGQEAASVLAEKLAISRPTLTGVVDGLVVRGLVLRAQLDADRRRVDVELTPEGAALLNAAEGEIEARLHAIASFLPPGDHFAAFDPWREALDGYREAKREVRRGAG